MKFTGATICSHFILQAFLQSPLTNNGIITKNSVKGRLLYQKYAIYYQDIIKIMFKLDGSLQHAERQNAKKGDV